MTTELVPLENAVALPYSAVYPNPDQPRTFFDEDKIEELRESIRLHGIQQPLTVRYEPRAYDGAPYKLIAGGRRYLAAEGVLDTLPCIIQNADEARAAELTLVENIQREDLTPLEEAKALRDLMKKHGLSTTRAAARLGVSQGWVNHRIALLKTGADVQQIAATTPKAMSSLLLVEEVKEPQTRRELLEEVKSGTPFNEIKARVSAHKSALEAQKSAEAAANRAPDTQTHTRLISRGKGETSAISRGQHLTGPGQKEARAEALRHIGSLEAWIPLLSDEDFDKIARKFARRITVGDLRR